MADLTRFIWVIYTALIYLSGYARALGGSDFGQVSIGDAKLGMFNVEVAIGTPPHTFKLLINTGAADSWVYSKMMSSQSSCGQDRRGYQATSSSTMQSDGRRGLIYYGNRAHVRGQLNRDTFRIGQVQVHNVTFLGVDYCLGEYLGQIDCDGVLGLGSFSQLGLSGVDLIQQAAGQSALNVPLFGLDFKKKQMTLGEDELDTKAQSEPHFVPTSGGRRWEVDVKLEIEQDDWAKASLEISSGISADLLRKQIDATYSAVLDSSANLVLLPSMLALIVNRYIGASELSQDPFEFDNQLGFTDCDPAGRPTVDFWLLGGKTGRFRLSIEPQDYMIKIENKLSDSNYTCISAFMVYRESHLRDKIVFGNLILRKYSTVFDSLNGLVGFS